MKTFLPSPRWQFFDSVTGAPLAGGKLYTYAAGTTTPLATYTDSTGATPNANPIVLDSRGECRIWAGDALYKFVLEDSLGNLIWTEDNHGIPAAYVIPSPLVNTDVQSPTIIRKVATIAALRLIAGSSSISAVQLLGYTTIGDGMGGPVRYWASGFSVGHFVDNGGSAIVPTGGDGSSAWCWLDAISWKISWFGNPADGTVAIDAANAWLLGATSAAPRQLIIDLPTVYKGTAKLAAIYAAGVSGISIDFVGGGYLSMENLVAGAAPGPAIFICGPAADITITDLDIQWPVASNARLYHGAVFKGYPSDANCLKRLRVRGVSQIKNAPNFSMLLSGVSDFLIGDVTHTGSLGDGLHINACQHGKAGHVQGYSPGDDGAAMVCYYGVTNSSGGYPNWNQTIAEWDLPAVDVWSNYNCHIGSVATLSGAATSCRIVGSKEATVGTVYSHGCGQAINGDAVVSGYGSYSHQANQGVRFGDVYSFYDFSSVSMQCLGAVAGTTASWNTADIVIGDITSQSPTHIVPLSFIDLLGVTCGNVTVKATNTLQNALVVSGTSGTKVGNIDVESADGSGAAIAVTGSSGTLKNSDNVVLGNIRAKGCSALQVLLNTATLPAKNLQVGNIESIDCLSSPLVLRSIDGLSAGLVNLQNWNTGNSAVDANMIGLYLEKCKNVTFAGFKASVLVTNYYAMMLAGNTAVGETDNITVTDCNISGPGTTGNFSFQVGANAPIHYEITGRYRRTDTNVWANLTYNTF